MNWKKEAENDLRRYMRRKDSLQNIQDKIASLDDRMQSIRGGMSDATPVQGGDIRAQENLINCIAEKERLVHTRAAVARLVKLVERGLAGLTDQERRVLELFYIQQQAGHVERLMEELHVEQTQIYRIKDAALYKFTVTLYGIVEF